MATFPQASTNGPLINSTFVPGSSLQRRSKLALQSLKLGSSTDDSLASSKLGGRIRTRRRSEGSLPLRHEPTQMIYRELKRCVSCELDKGNHDYTQYVAMRCISESITEGDIEILRAWLHEPMLVTDEQLPRILHIQQSTSKSPKLSSASVCYFRSWTMLAWQLRKVIEDLVSQGFFHDLLRNWLSLLKTCSRETIVTPRYVGTTSSPSNPWQRTQAQPKRPNSIKGAFIDSLEFLFPDIAKSHKIYTIMNTMVFDLHRHQSTDINAGLLQRATHLLVDQFEKGMIGYFRPQTLLNCQFGGQRPTITPTQQDERAFLRCGTSLLSRLTRGHLARDGALSEKVAQLFKDW